MTLNSEGLLPCPFCGGENSYVQNAGWKANTFIRCPDCPSSFATCDGPRPHEDSVVAWNRRALPPVDGLEVVAELNRVIAEEAADFADAAGHAIEAGERPDLWDREVEVAVHTLSQASSVIAGLKAERDAARAEIGVACNDLRSFMTTFVRENFPNNKTWKPLPDLLGMLSQMDNASTIARDYRDRIYSLEEENKRLREALELVDDLAENYMNFDPDSRFGLAIRAVRKALEYHNG